MGLSILVAKSSFQWEFEEGIGYEANVYVDGKKDNASERLTFSANGRNGELFMEETPWISQKWFFDRRIRKAIFSAEKKLHRRLEKSYQRNLFFHSCTEKD